MEEKLRFVTITVVTAPFFECDFFFILYIYIYILINYI